MNKCCMSASLLVCAIGAGVPGSTLAQSPYPAKLGVDTVGNSPAQAAKLVADEMERWTAVIKAAGVKAE